MTKTPIKHPYQPTSYKPPSPTPKRLRPTPSTLSILITNLPTTSPTITLTLPSSPRPTPHTLDPHLPPHTTLYHNTHPLPLHQPLPNLPFLILKARSFGLKGGGKGGFGAILRGSRAKNVTTDFGSCRDLKGRRLRVVERERRVREWVERGGGEGVKKRRRVGEGNGGVEGGREDVVGEGFGVEVEEGMEEKVGKLERVLDGNAERVLEAVEIGIRKRLAGKGVGGKNGGKIAGGSGKVEEMAAGSDKQYCIGMPKPNDELSNRARSDFGEEVVSGSGFKNAGGSKGKAGSAGTESAKESAQIEKRSSDVDGETDTTVVEARYKPGKDSGTVLNVQDQGDDNVQHEDELGNAWTEHFEGLESCSDDEDSNEPIKA